MTEHVRDVTGNDGDVRYDGLPLHDAPMTWRTCIAEGCTVRVDPRDHNHRCPRHRAKPVDLDRVHAIVREHRDAERRKVDARG